jgi:SAM-dependent methyltransferase
VTKWNAHYARDYERHWSPVIRPMAEAVLSRLPLADARHVLDIGAGCGALVPGLRAAAPGSTVIGIDYSLEMLRYAHSRGVPVAAMDAASLGLATGSFDAALSAFMLFILPDPAGALREAGRVLRPGGWLATVTWGVDSDSRAEEIWEEELLAAGAPPRPTHPSSARVNAPAKMIELCGECGFHPEEAWKETFEHVWEPDVLIQQKSARGLATRLFDLPEPSRERVMKRAREQFASLDRDAFVWSAEVVYCVAQTR